MKKRILILAIVLLASPLYAESYERTLQGKIDAIIASIVEINKKPSPTGSPRAARIARNRYRNCCSRPIYPKTIYREKGIKRPGSHQRFYGGIPRGG